MLAWFIIILLFLMSFIGVVVPVVPSVLALWGGFLTYHFFIDSGALSIFFWLWMILFTIVILGADFLINFIFVDRFGGSRASQWGAMIGLVVGVFIYPPLGIVLLPFLIVFFIELTIHGSFEKSLSISLATIAGFLSSTLAKVILQLTMIVIFFIFVFI